MKICHFKRKSFEAMKYSNICLKLTFYCIHLYSVFSIKITNHLSQLLLLVRYITETFTTLNTVRFNTFTHLSGIKYRNKPGYLRNIQTTYFLRFLVVIHYCIVLKVRVIRLDMARVSVGVGYCCRWRRSLPSLNLSRVISLCANSAFTNRSYDKHMNTCCM